jgi:hypothetical protein
MSDRPLPQLLKPTQAGAVLGIGPKALRAFDDELKPAYLNSRVKRYSVEALEAFIARKRGLPDDKRA